MPVLDDAPIKALCTDSAISTFSDAADEVAANDGVRGSQKATKNDLGSLSGPHQFFVKPENFIWLELSLVREVESVFIQRDGNAFDVLIVVNDRDDELRNRIYDREAEIIDHLTEFDFSFRVLPRMGLPESRLNIPTFADYKRT